MASREDPLPRFAVQTGPSSSGAAASAIELVDSEAQTRIALEPARGAIVTSFRAGERELLYLDAATLADATKNVRGGIPVLFPSPGKLEGDRWSRGGKGGVMRQHGFARNLAWRLASQSRTSAAEVQLELTADESTRAVYPFDFRVGLTFTLRGTRLRIAQEVTNRGAGPMPFGFGFHPYFAVRDKARAAIATRATRAFDNVTKAVVPFTGFDLTREEVDLHLLDHGSTASALTLEDGGRIGVDASPEYVRWVVWTQRGKDFVCVEPWTCPGNALNTGEGLITLAPGVTRSLWIELSYTPPPQPE